MEEEAVKKLVETTEVEGEGLTALLGENVLVMCANYFYAGKLIGVNDSCILLGEASIVYETGTLTDSAYKDSQKLPAEWYIQTAAIESFGKSGR